jgi:hypothetical protein
VQHDYRRVLEQSCKTGLEQTISDLSFYDHTFNTGFTNNKIADLIKTQHAVASSCFYDTTLETDRFEKISEVMVYPNQLQISSPFLYKTAKSAVALFSLDGKFIANYNNPQISNQFTYQNFHLDSTI